MFDLWSGIDGRLWQHTDCLERVRLSFVVLISPRALITDLMLSKTVACDQGNLSTYRASPPHVLILLFFLEHLPAVSTPPTSALIVSLLCTLSWIP